MIIHKIQSKWILAIAASISLSACIGSSDDGNHFKLSWTFNKGDCSSNHVAKIKATATKSTGEILTGEAACSASSLDLGSASAGDWTVKISGIDSSGKIRAENTMWHKGDIMSSPSNITLLSKGTQLQVNWNGCPAGATIPYMIDLYDNQMNPVDEFQADCSAYSHSFSGLSAGKYTVILESITSTPYVKSTRSITIIDGQDTSVEMGVPFQ